MEIVKGKPRRDRAILRMYNLALGSLKALMIGSLPPCLFVKSFPSRIIARSSVKFLSGSSVYVVFWRLCAAGFFRRFQAEMTSELDS